MTTYFTNNLKQKGGNITYYDGNNATEIDLVYILK